MESESASWVDLKSEINNYYKQKEPWTSTKFVHLMHMGPRQEVHIFDIDLHKENISHLLPRKRKTRPDRTENFLTGM